MIKKCVSVLLAFILICAAVPFCAFSASATFNATVLVLDTETECQIANAGDAVYYQFTPEIEGTYKFFSIGNSDTIGYLYDSDMNELAQDDDNGGKDNFMISCRLNADTTYYYKVMLYGSETGSFTVKLTRENEAEQLTGDCYWTIDENGVLTISGNGAMGDYYPNIKVQYNDPWSGYEDITPWDPDTVTKVVIEEGVTRIGDGAFCRCENLTSVEIPGTVTSIGDFAFCFCRWELFSVDIPNSVTSIENYAFYQCFNLTAVTMPESVTGLGKGVFAQCCSLSNVNIPGNLTTINDEMFKGCELLNNIVIPDSVTSIGDYAFQGCTSLTSLTLSGSLQSIGMCAFRNCSELTTLRFPDSLQSIGNSAFQYCAKLKRVTFSGGINVGSYAFEGCGLRSVVITETGVLAGSPTTFEYKAFSECNNLNGVYISSLATWCKASFEIEGSNPLSFAKNLYLNDDPVTDIVIPDGITKINDYAFYNCSTLNSVVIPESVTSIGYLAFYCSSLKSVTIPESVVSIGGYAYSLDYGGTVFIDDAFYYRNLTIYGYENSFAQTYAQSKNISFVAIIPQINGDATGDGAVTIDDATEIQRYLAEFDFDDTTRLQQCGDVTGDNKITISDVTAIQRYLADIENINNIGQQI